MKIQLNFIVKVYIGHLSYTTSRDFLQEDLMAADHVKYTQMM